MGPASSQQIDATVLAWARAHRRQRRRHAAELAQITLHHDPGDRREAIGQQRAWTRRRERARHLHTSALAQLRRRSTG